MPACLPAISNWGLNEKGYTEVTYSFEETVTGHEGIKSCLMALQTIQTVLLHSLGYLYRDRGLTLPLLPGGQFSHGCEAMLKASHFGCCLVVESG